MKIHKNTKTECILKKFNCHYSKLIFLAGPEGPRDDIRITSELNSLKTKKEQEGESLDGQVGKLANATNGTFNAYYGRLKELPRDFQKELKDHIVNYFLSAADKYDQDHIKGLNRHEFNRYHVEMIARADMIINRFVPHQDVLKAEKEAQKETADKEKEVKEKSAAILEAGDDFDPNNLNTPEGIQQEMTKIYSQSGKIYKEAEKGFSVCADMQTASSRYFKLSAWKQLDPFFGRGPELRESINSRYRIAILEAVNTIPAKINERKKQIKNHGKLISEAVNKIKQKIIESRNEELQKLSGRDEGKKNQQLYKEFQKKHEELSKTRNELLQKRDTELDELRFARPETTRRTDPQSQIANAINIIDRTLADGSSNLTPEQKAFLVQKKGALTNARSEYAAQRAKVITTHVESVLNPALETTEQTLRLLQIKQLENGDQREQIFAKYMPALDGIDQFAKLNQESILDINVSNSLITNSLEKTMRQSLLITAREPGIYKATVGHVFNNVGRGIKYVTNDLISKNLLKLGNYLQGSKIPGLKQAGYVVGGAVKVVGGVVEAAGDLVGGIAHMIADPKAILASLGSLIGRDPDTGKWGTKNAKASWTRLIESSFAAEEHGKGEHGRGLGKFFVNIASFFIPAGAAAKAIGAGRRLIKKPKGPTAGTAPIAEIKGAGGGVRQTEKAVAQSAPASAARQAGPHPRREMPKGARQMIFKQYERLVAEIKAQGITKLDDIHREITRRRPELIRKVEQFATEGVERFTSSRLMADSSRLGITERQLSSIQAKYADRLSITNSPAKRSEIFREAKRDVDYTAYRNEVNALKQKGITNPLEIDKAIMAKNSELMNRINQYARQGQPPPVPIELIKRERAPVPAIADAKTPSAVSDRVGTAVGKKGVVTPAGRDRTAGTVVLPKTAAAGGVLDRAAMIAPKITKVAKKTEGQIRSTANQPATLEGIKKVAASKIDDIVSDQLNINKNITPESILKTIDQRLKGGHLYKLMQDNNMLTREYIKTTIEAVKKSKQRITEGIQRAAEAIKPARRTTESLSPAQILERNNAIQNMNKILEDIVETNIKLGKKASDITVQNVRDVLNASRNTPTYTLLERYGLTAENYIETALRSTLQKRQSAGTAVGRRPNRAQN